MSGIFVLWNRHCPRRNAAFRIKESCRQQSELSSRGRPRNDKEYIYRSKRIPSKFWQVSIHLLIEEQHEREWIKPKRGDNSSSVTFCRHRYTSGRDHASICDGTSHHAVMWHLRSTDANVSAWRFAAATWGAVRRLVKEGRINYKTAEGY